MMCPSRDRPGNIADLIKAWTTTTQADTRLVVAVDDDDPQLEAYQGLQRALVRSTDSGCAWSSMDQVEFVYGPRSGMRLGGTLNELAARYAPSCTAIGFLGDDHRPRTVGWDRTFLDVLTRSQLGIVYANDLLQKDRIPTSVAMTSNIPRALGYFVPPGLVHLFFDNAWKQLGESLGCLTYLADVVIEHMHPIAGKAAWDVHYSENNSRGMYRQDAQAFGAWLDNGLVDGLDRILTAVLAAVKPAGGAVIGEKGPERIISLGGLS